LILAIQRLCSAAKQNWKKAEILWQTRIWPICQKGYEYVKTCWRGIVRDGGILARADFIRDVALRCAAQLAAAGYTYPSGDDRELIRTYVSVKNRRIQTRPRKVHKEPYSVPEHLVIGEQQLLARIMQRFDGYGALGAALV
jgi:hypothetical protein